MKRSVGDRIALGSMYFVITLFSLFCLFPILMTLGVSFSNEGDVVRHGYSLIPRHLSTKAYYYIFHAIGDNLLRGYGVTIFVTVVGTAASMLVTSTYAYAASVKSFKYRNVLNLLCYIPMVFSSGLLPWYIILTKYYQMTDKIYALFLPSLMNLFFVFLTRNYFSVVPIELAEAAKIDGASHSKIFFRIYVPVARVGLITVALFYALNYWNDFFLALMFINKQEYYPLQYYLYNMLTNADFISTQSNLGYKITAPLETTKMALTIITIGPIVLLFPFIQRFFTKGIVVGGVKG